MSAHCFWEEGQVRAGVRHTSEYTATPPDATQCLRDRIASVGGYRCLQHFQWLAESGNFEEIERGAQQEVGELDGLLLRDSGGGHRRTG